MYKTLYIHIYIIILDTVYILCIKLCIFFPLQIFTKVPQKKYKANQISKTKNCTKKVICAKNERQINSKLSCKFGYFWRKLNFWAPKRPFWTPKRYDMWYEILHSSIFLAHHASFMSRWPLLRRGRGICISLVRKQPNIRIRECR